MLKINENNYNKKSNDQKINYFLHNINGKEKSTSLYTITYKRKKSKFLFAKTDLLNKKLKTFKQTSNFSFWLDEWLSVSKSRVKESTYIRYKNSIDNHIKPALGSIKITEITTALIEKFISQKLENGNLQTGKGLSPKTVSDFLIIIKNTIKYAHSDGVKINCHFESLTIRKKNHEMRVLSVDEEKRLIKTLLTNTERYKLGVLLCLFTGIRIGELCALKWQDISLKDKTIRITKTMQRIQCTDYNKTTKTHIVITEPKSDSSCRIIPLQDSIVSVLKQFIAKPECYLLTGMSKTYIEPRTMQNKFKGYLADSMIDKANFHSLRHTFATRCIELGFDIKTLSELLGHSSVKITLDRYVHSSLNLKRDCINKLDLLLKH